ncbi:hypothetical protein [Terrihalobacillus insolitus]|uniref:hypothetical protein n=1 Tax=Terrihalobacillus insolitus TaxID=2950438 RepID=UPI00234248E4|nr:hypothetical protein [Terrihalobacillus insolitus]MDC3414245.1 hypothetical protein [Terrihalobacillus insolitus]
MKYRPISNDNHTISFVLDDVAEGILDCYKYLIEIANELDSQHEDELKSICDEIVAHLHKIKPLYY